MARDILEAPRLKQAKRLSFVRSDVGERFVPLETPSQRCLMAWFA